MRPTPWMMDLDYESPEAKGRRLAKEHLEKIYKESVAILKKKNKTRP